MRCSLDKVPVRFGMVLVTVGSVPRYGLVRCWLSRYCRVTVWSFEVMVREGTGMVWCVPIWLGIIL